MRKNPDEYYEGDPSIWQKTSWNTQSTVKWFWLDEKTGEKCPIHISGDMYRESCRDMTIPLPAGWTRHQCAVLGEGGEPFFRHEQEPVQEFWYPIPLPPPPPPPPQGRKPSQIRASYLWCHTRRAVLRLGEVFTNHLTSECWCIDLVDPIRGRWIGAVRLPSKRVFETLAKGEQQEFIELSAGSVLKQETEMVSIDEWFRKECPIQNGSYEFFNVMAIAWVGQVAYRQAIGRVVKSAWQHLAMEEIELRLG